MTATCAVCMTAILTRSDVRVSGTEVMHADCARRGGETVNWRLRQLLANLQRDIEAANRRIKDLEHDVGRAQTETRQAERALNVSRRNHQRVKARLEGDLAALQREMAQATEALKNQAALLAAAGRSDQTMPSRVQQQPADDAGRVHTPPESEMDPTEVRFSLLELDPL